MRARLWPALLTLAALLAAHAATADPVGRYLYFTPFGGFTTFDSDFRWPHGNPPDFTRSTGYPLEDKPYFGGRLGYQVGGLWALELAGGITPTNELIGSLPGGDVSFKHLSGSIVMRPFAARAGGPYLFAGFGGGRNSGKVEQGDGTTQDEDFNLGLLEFGGGVRYWLSDFIGLRLEARDMHWMPHKDVPSPPQVDHFLLGLGLDFAIGARARDTDHDGVADSRDKCPGTPLGAVVDKAGCPIDSDGDAVFDGLDKCPGTPKGCTVDKTGCPNDADGDGVCDGVDQCADTPKGATVDAKGCPSDADGDGVLDGIDQCPDTPKGCKADEKGCPVDADGDGVCDGVDQCPNTPAGMQVDGKGCPVEAMQRSQELREKGKIEVRDVKFETGKADILPEFQKQLDAIGLALLDWPMLKLEIDGHTDSRGTASSNRKLALRRAESVRTYLTGRYPQLPAGMFTVKGFGEDRPVATNKTPEGMAQNRRVEFNVLNKDVLQQELQRQLEQKQAAPADTTGNK